MNNPISYRRPQPATQAASTTDPGQPGSSPSHRRQVAWVRPTDLPAFGGQAIAHTIEAHAELTRTMRSLPGQAARAAQTRAVESFGTPAVPRSRMEGPSL